MAKQTFTTGQVLLASQLTSLQQTAMSGGAAQAKTSSYVLVAADAGTAISMTSTSATTVTVNNGLFAAGDTVFIQNLGSGNLTITAGTATVNTAGSLILPQYDAGILYFVSASSSIFYDYIQAGAVSPLTTKGDVYTFSTSDARLAVGANGTVLTADSAEATGLKFAAPAGAKSYALISTTSITGASTTISSLSGYDELLVLFSNISNVSASATLALRLNGSSTNADYSNQTGMLMTAQNPYSAVEMITSFATTNQGNFKLCRLGDSAGSTMSGYIRISGANTSGLKIVNTAAAGGNNVAVSQQGLVTTGIFNGTAVISSVTFLPTGTTSDFDNGTAVIYGAV